MNYSHSHERGAISGLLITTIALAVLLAGTGGAAVWAYMNYTDQKNNVDAKVAVAVAEANKKQADKLEAEFLKREQLPYEQFVGPDDYGRLMFDYSKTWSVHVAEDTSNGNRFEAYLNPGIVPPLDDSTQFALRVTIEDKDYEDVLDDYSNRVENGELRSSGVSVDGNNGTRLDGSFSDDIRGSAVIYKIRDKTVTLRTDAETFRPAFDELIKTITFNK